jgi:hypothetical protein
VGKLRWTIALFPVLLTLPFACHSASPARDDGATLATGLALTASFDPDSDVAAMRFTIHRKTCSGESFTPFGMAIVQALPGLHISGLAGVPNVPIGPGSAHLFSDLFLAVEAGCYDVSMAPLTAQNQPSAVCAPAFPESLVVADGQTTEVALFSQCDTQGGGFGDTAVGLNHPPAITSIDFSPSKFLGVCAGSITQAQTICATASDADADPLQLTWIQTGGTPVSSGPTVKSTTLNADGSVTQCVQLVPATLGNVTFTVTVFDLVKNPGGPGYITWEQYFTWAADPHASHDAASFPSYAVDDPSVCGGSGQDGGCPCTCDTADAGP